MKKLILLPAVALLGFLPSIASARTHVDLFFGFNAGAFFAPVRYCEPTPVIVVPAPCAPMVYSQPVYVAPQQVIVQQPVCPPQVVYSAPQVVYSAPVVCNPPVVFYSAPRVVYVPAHRYCYDGTVFYPRR